MGLGNKIKNVLVYVFGMIYNSRKSKCIFYHDIHSDKQYTDMSTPIELFKKHINIIRASAYEIVSKITKTHGQIEICFDDAFLGLLADGFPVYGPLEDGMTITNSDLDEYHGHVSATEDFPNGIYHYHVTPNEDPYLNGNGYFGTPGNITQ